MSVDRSIRLDLSTAGLAGGHLADVAGGNADSAAPRDFGQADPEAARRFQTALDSPVASTEKSSPPVLPPSPFGLFRAAVAPSAVEKQETAGGRSFSELLGVEVERLMVGEGRSGGQEIRMDLKDEALPGVTVVIGECEGRLQVDFICCEEASRLKLCAVLDHFAETLAGRLSRDVLVRVMTDDEEDPRLCESLAMA